MPGFFSHRDPCKPSLSSRIFTGSYWSQTSFLYYLCDKVRQQNCPNNETDSIKNYAVLQQFLLCSTRNVSDCLAES